MPTETSYVDEPIEVVCAAIYHAELIPAYAFVFRVPATWTRFTIYAPTADAYTINHTYRLAITEPRIPSAPPAGGADAGHDRLPRTPPNPAAAEVDGGGTAEAPEYATLTMVLARTDGQRWRWSDVHAFDPPMWLDVGVPQFWAAEPGITDTAVALGAEVEEPLPGPDDPAADR